MKKIIYLFPILFFSCSSIVKLNNDMWSTTLSSSSIWSKCPIHQNAKENDYAVMRITSMNLNVRYEVVEINDNLIVREYRYMPSLLEKASMTDFSKIYIEYILSNDGTVIEAYTVSELSGKRTKMNNRDYKPIYPSDQKLFDQGNIYNIEVSGKKIPCELVINKKKKYYLIFYNRNIPFMLVQIMELSEKEYNEYMKMPLKNRERFNKHIVSKLVEWSH